MRLRIALAVSVTLLSGCGGQEGGNDAAAPVGTEAPSSSSQVPTKPTASATTSQAPQEIDVPHACPRLRAIVETDGLDETVADWEASLNELDALETEGDARVDDVIAVVRPAIEKNRAYAVEGHPAGKGGAAFNALSEAMLAVAEAGCMPN